MNDNTPLVSVAVITYNSSDYLLETLESIKAQTYQNIELIVSDDCSSDKTVQICKEWIKNNESRFTRVVLLESSINTGVSGNDKRAKDACNGEWIKGIAGDDILLPKCIEDCIHYVLAHPDALVLFGRIKPFGGNQETRNAILLNIDYAFFGKTPEEQLNQLIHVGNCIPAPASFIRYDKLKEQGIFYDERIPMMEDYPFWINILSKAIKLHYIDQEIVGYRVGGVSTSNMPSMNYFRSQRLFRFYYQYPEWCKTNIEDAVQTIVKEECELYAEILRLMSTKAYRFGKFILKPFHKLKNNHKLTA